MTITDQVKGAAAAVTDKVAEVTGTNAQVCWLIPRSAIVSCITKVD